jgi:lipoprotein NlpD
MAFTRVKISLALWLILIVPTACGDFRAIFNGKPSHPVAKGPRPGKPPEKHRDQPAPEETQGFFAWPIQAPVSSPYGMRGGRFHDGIDIDGDSGEEVAASAAGTVVYSGKLGGYGNLIVIRHTNGFFTAYAHNKKNLVKKGRAVDQGQVIAQVGSTGHATGAHLHFEIRDPKGTYDPLAILPKQSYSRR